MAWRGEARPGTARHGAAGAARPGKAGLGMARRGMARRGRRGKAGLGTAVLGMAGRGRRGKAGKAWLGTAGRGSAWLGEAGMVFYQPLLKGLKMSESFEAKWKPGYRRAAAVSAEKAFKALERIRKKNDGELDPSDIVAEAKSPRNALHGCFEWDDTVAAHEHRLEQARLVSRSIVIERVETPGVETRQYELTRSKHKPRKQVYVSTDDIMKDPEARSELLQRALGDLLAARRRYSKLQELSIVFRAIDDVFETVKP